MPENSKRSMPSIICIYLEKKRGQRPMRMSPELCVKKKNRPKKAITAVTIKKRGIMREKRVATENITNTTKANNVATVSIMIIITDKHAVRAKVIPMNMGMDTASVVQNTLRRFELSSPDII